MATFAICLHDLGASLEHRMHLLDVTHPWHALAVQGTQGPTSKKLKFPPGGGVGGRKPQLVS